MQEYTPKYFLKQKCLDHVRHKLERKVRPTWGGIRKHTWRSPGLPVTKLRHMLGSEQSLAIRGNESRFMIFIISTKEKLLNNPRKSEPLSEQSSS